MHEVKECSQWGSVVIVLCRFMRHLQNQVLVFQRTMLILFAYRFEYKSQEAVIYRTWDGALLILVQVGPRGSSRKNNRLLYSH